MNIKGGFYEKAKIDRVDPGQLVERISGGGQGMTMPGWEPERLAQLQALLEGNMVRLSSVEEPFAIKSRSVGISAPSRMDLAQRPSKPTKITCSGRQSEQLFFSTCFSLCFPVETYTQPLWQKARIKQADNTINFLIK
jgi:hypothetical protein